MLSTLILIEYLGSERKESTEHGYRLSRDSGNCHLNRVLIRREEVASREIQHCICHEFVHPNKGAVCIFTSPRRKISIRFQAKNRERSLLLSR